MIGAVQEVVGEVVEAALAAIVLVAVGKYWELIAVFGSLCTLDVLVGLADAGVEVPVYGLEVGRGEGMSYNGVVASVAEALEGYRSEDLACTRIRSVLEAA